MGAAYPLGRSKGLGRLIWKGRPYFQSYSRGELK